MLLKWQWGEKLLLLITDMLEDFLLRPQRVGHEALVNCAFEVAVGRKVAVADYRHVGRFSAEASKSRPLLIRLASVWDHRLLLGSKYKLKGFTEAKLFVREDKPPAERTEDHCKAECS